MKIMRLTPILLVSVLSIPTTNALTGSSLLEYCIDAVEKNFTFHAGSCVSTIDTTRKMLDKYQKDIVDRTDAVCFPNEVNSADGLVQLVEVVLKYLEDNPRNLGLEAWGLVILALVESFPCNE